MKNESGEVYKKIISEYISEIKNRKLKKEFRKELILEDIIKKDLGTLDCRLKGNIYRQFKEVDFLNKDIKIGNLITQPDLNYTDNGTPVCEFRIVVVESYKDSKTGKRKENKDYFVIKVWRGLAKACAEYLQIGSLVAVEGKLKIRESKANNTTYQNPEIIADNVEFLDWLVSKKIMKERFNLIDDPEQQSV